VIAGLHRNDDYPHSKHAGPVVKPPKVPVGPLFPSFFHRKASGCLAAVGRVGD
jgi:hypothetical protein